MVDGLSRDTRYFFAYYERLVEPAFTEPLFGDGKGDDDVEDVFNLADFRIKHSDEGPSHILPPSKLEGVERLPQGPFERIAKVPTLEVPLTGEARPTDHRHAHVPST